MSASQHSQTPTNAQGWHARGNALRQQGDSAGAIAALNQALKCQPDFADACFDLAVLLEESAAADIAIKTYQYLLNIAPKHAKGKVRLDALLALLQKSFVPHQQGVVYYNRGDMEKAIACFRQSLAIHPRVPNTLANLGLALYHLRHFDEAQAVLAEAIRLQPAHIGALGTRGNIYQSLHLHDQALAIYRHIVALKPDDIKSWVNIGKVLQRMGDDAGAVEAYEAALRIDPDYAEALAERVYRLHRLCRWEKTGDAIATLVTTLATTRKSASPFTVTLYADAPLQLENAKRYAATHHAIGKACYPAHPLPADARGDGKLRIGYLSADFYSHATAFLISELFEQHDKDRFDIIAYSCSAADKSAEQTRIRKSVRHFRDIQPIDNRTACEIIQRDGVDIMVDLKGYTRSERISLMALRPAPIQMHYLGYPGTTGAPFIDYFIADPVTAPEGAEAEFSEKLIRLPHSYQINDRKRPLPASGFPKTSYGLPEQSFVFCDFNNPYKITPEMFAVWMRLLAAVPDSVLWLYETHAEATDNMRKAAQEHGIDPARIIAARAVPIWEHMARYRHVDLFVDTFPVCGHTTASDALWCGAPVVTMAGNNFVSRVAASLLHAVGLPELVAKNISEYEEMALGLARNREKLALLKRHLEEGRMTFPLFDSLATTRSLEAAYEQATKRHRAGLAPQSFNIPA